MMGVAIPARYPSGKKRARAGPPRTLWRRLADNRDNLVALGGHTHWGSVLGLLRLTHGPDGSPILTERQYQAGRVYGEVAGRYRRFHADESLPVTAPSPAFQRGSRGKDGELDRLLVQGRIRDYEKQAKKAKKAWAKVQSVIPSASARNLIEEVCIYDREIASAQHRALAQLLGAIAGRFFGARAFQD